MRTTSEAPTSTVDVSLIATSALQPILGAALRIQALN
jgi:hypothetical protein